MIDFQNSIQNRVSSPDTDSKKVLRIVFYIYNIYIYIYISNLCSYKIRFDHHTETYKKKTNVETLYKIWFVPFVS